MFTRAYVEKLGTGHVVQPEMVPRTLEDGGQISVIHGGPPQIVAKLCFPMA
jgi:hypothetical protein